MNDLEKLSPFIVFVFALFFYYASKQGGCWYKRYVFSGMFVFLAVLSIENSVAVFLYLSSSILSWFGFKGYGKEKIKEKKEVEK